MLGMDKEIWRFTSSLRKCKNNSIFDIFVNIYANTFVVVLLS